MCSSIIEDIESCFFVNDTATTEIYTLSLHDALPIFRLAHSDASLGPPGLARSLGSRKPLDPRNPSSARAENVAHTGIRWGDRKSTRLNSSHANISYAVFCLKKKTTQ